MTTGPLILPMLFVALWSALLLALGAWTLDRTLRRLRYQTRFVWLGTMLLGTSLVIATPWRMLLATAEAATGADAASSGAAASGLAAPILVTPLLEGIAAFAQSALALFPEGAGTVVRTLWIASAVLAAVFLIVGYAINHAIVLRAPHTQIGDVRVRLTEAFGPAVIGVRDPEIVVPRWVLERPIEEQRLVVAHERAHIAARDPLLLCVGASLAVLTAWNPLTWWAFGRLRLATELDCDTRVLRAGVPARAYGNLLLDLTAALPRQQIRLGAPAFSARPSQLEERIRAMTTRSVGPVRRKAMLIGSALLAVVTVVAACSATLDSPLSPKVAEVGAQKDGQQVYFDFQTDKAAAPVPGGAGVRYPTDLRAQGIEGEVLVQFIVGTDGKIDLESFRVLKSSAPEFEEAVRAALPALRFVPAEVKGAPVKQLVQQPFIFQLSR
jgi:bla regulator protein blaR1